MEKLILPYNPEMIRFHFSPSDVVILQVFHMLQTSMK
jgi:hypothetical protein